MPITGVSVPTRGRNRVLVCPCFPSGAPLYDFGVDLRDCVARRGIVGFQDVIPLRELTVFRCAGSCTWAHVPQQVWLASLLIDWFFCNM